MALEGILKRLDPVNREMLRLQLQLHPFYRLRQI